MSKNIGGLSSLIKRVWARQTQRQTQRKIEARLESQTAWRHFNANADANANADFNFPSNRDFAAPFDISGAVRHESFRFLAADELRAMNLRDDELQLNCAQFQPPNAMRNTCPQYVFHMTRAADNAKMGSIALRIGDTEFLTHFAGQIGYGVENAFRGRHLAARSVRLLLPLARLHGLNPLWITCNPENLASRRSCEIAGATLFEIVDLPHNCEMYARGERRKCRYKIELRKANCATINATHSI